MHQLIYRGVKYFKQLYRNFTVDISESDNQTKNQFTVENDEYSKYINNDDNYLDYEEYLEKQSIDMNDDLDLDETNFLSNLSYSKRFGLST